MKSFHIKSILLGIGIGIILTSLITMIYMAGANNSTPQMGNAEILEKAKVLGLVEPEPILDDKKQESTKTSDPGGKVTPSESDKGKGTQGDAAVLPAEPAKEQPDLQVQEIQLDIIKGDTSESVGGKLLKLGFIKEVKAFVDTLSQMNLTSEINIGQFKIKKGATMDQIIKIITTVPK